MEQCLWVRTSESQGKRPLLRRMQQVCCSIRHLQCLESGPSAFVEFGIPLAVVCLETWNRRQRSEQRAKPSIDAMPGLSRQPKSRSRSRARVFPFSSVPMSIIFLLTNSSFSLLSKLLRILMLTPRSSLLFPCVYSEISASCSHPQKKLGMHILMLWRATARWMLEEHNIHIHVCIEKVRNV